MGQEQVPIEWKFEERMWHKSVQTIKIKKVQAEVKEDKKTVLRALPGENVVLECLIDWRVPERKNDQVVVNIFFTKGKINIQKGSEKYFCEVDNPKHAKKLESPMFAEHLKQVRGGIAFRLDLKQARVLTSWILQEKEIKKPGEKDKENEKRSYEMTEIPGDPFCMEDSYKQLPGKLCPVGFEWPVTRRQGNLTYKYQYKFVRTTTFRDKKVAVIEIKGDILLNKDKVGDVKGTYYFDYINRFMLAQETTETREMFYPMRSTTKEDSKKPKKKEEKPAGTLEKTEINVKVELLQHSTAKNK